MIRLLKRLFDKLDPPANDWVLSRFGGNEAPVSVRGSRVTSVPEASLDEAPLSGAMRPMSEAMPAMSEAMPPSSKGAFDHWFDDAETIDASPPQSREMVSPNASHGPVGGRDAERRAPSVSGEMVAVREPERKSRVS